MNKPIFLDDQLFDYYIKRINEIPPYAEYIKSFLSKLYQICDDYKQALEKIIFLKPTKFREQAAAVNKLSSLIKKDIGAIFVDTITMLYRAELKEKIDRDLNNALAKQMRSLLEIARKHNIPVIITTQVYADFEKKDQVKLVGGNIIKNISKCLIELKKSGPNRIALIKKHRSIEEGKKIMFRIVDEGITEINK